MDSSTSNFPSFPIDKLIKVGKVLSIVDVLVVIETLESMPPLNLDTVLFKCNGTPMGQIFDVFGPVTAPHYSIRFENADQIKQQDIHTEMAVYFVPLTDETITKFAFVNEIKKKYKGTDASWEHDQEPPESVVEYSDDEQETLAKRANKAKKRTYQQTIKDPPD